MNELSLQGEFILRSTGCRVKSHAFVTTSDVPSENTTCLCGAYDWRTWAALTRENGKEKRPAK